MVFDATVAPRSRADFLAWCESQTEWTESHGYNDPEIPAPTLKNWFRELIQTYPPMNGPLASDDVDDPRMTDYSLGRSVIYGAFAWSQAEDALQWAAELAAKHGVGLYEISSESGEIWIPDGNGELSPIPE